MLYTIAHDQMGERHYKKSPPQFWLNGILAVEFEFTIKLVIII